MFRILFLFLLSIALSGFSKEKVEKHYGKVSSIMGNYEGLIQIHLKGENPDMIEIELGTTKEKKKRSTYTETRSVKLNVAAIRNLLIDGVEYVIKDVEYEQNKYYKNCCLQLDVAITNGSLFKFNNDDHLLYVMHLKNYKEAKYLKLVSKFSVITLFKECEVLLTKIRNKEEGYELKEEMDDATRIDIWKKWFTEFNACTVH